MAPNYLNAAVSFLFTDFQALYSMVKRIADGSFGMVYQMQNKITRDLVAAKRLKHRKPEDVYFSRKEVHILDKIRWTALVKKEKSMKHPKNITNELLPTQKWTLSIRNKKYSN